MRIKNLSLQAAVLFCGWLSTANAFDGHETFEELAAQLSVDISNLPGLIQDAKHAREIDESHRAWPIAPTPTSYDELVANLQTPELLMHLSQAYQEAILNPFLASLMEAGSDEVNAILNPSDPANVPPIRQLIEDVYQALTQSVDPGIKVATDAFQELASDIYDEFLYRESRAGVSPPELEILPPLVKWGSGGGPYTLGVDDLSQGFGKKFATTVVVLPSSHILAALSGWSTLGHEIGGHDVTMADVGLLEEIREVVYAKVLHSDVSQANRSFLASYWGYVNPQTGEMRINETAADVLGTLHFGPITGPGMLAYFPGYFSPDLTIPTQGSFYDDPHPVSIIRPFLIAQVVRHLPLKEAKIWADIIDQQATHALGNKKIIISQGRTGYVIPTDDMIKSARAVADAIVGTPLKTLEGHAILSIMGWSDEDEAIAHMLSNALEKGDPLPADYDNGGFYAAHVVTAATLSGLKKGANVPLLFTRMQAYLAAMHNKNPDWESLQAKLDEIKKAA